jgi:hypothetical protein
MFALAMFEVWLRAVRFCGPPASAGEETDTMCGHRGQRQRALDRRRMGEFRGEYGGEHRRPLGDPQQGRGDVTFGERWPGVASALNAEVS